MVRENKILMQSNDYWYEFDDNVKKWKMTGIRDLNCPPCADDNLDESSSMEAFHSAKECNDGFIDWIYGDSEKYIDVLGTLTFPEIPDRCVTSTKDNSPTFVLSHEEI